MRRPGKRHREPVASRESARAGGLGRPGREWIAPRPESDLHSTRRIPSGYPRVLELYPAIVFQPSSAQFCFPYGSEWVRLRLSWFLTLRQIKRSATRCEGSVAVSRNSRHSIGSGRKPECAQTICELCMTPFAFSKRRGHRNWRGQVPRKSDRARAMSGLDPLTRAGVRSGVAAWTTKAKRRHPDGGRP
jgi:hypothetical protein